MSWSELSEKLMLEFLFIISLFIVALRLLLRPRKPKVIYAHFNRMIERALFLPLATALLGLYVMVLFAFSFKVIPDSPYTPIVFSLGMLTYVILNTVYVLYWSHPFSRKRTGVKAVDEAVERYKKSGEQVSEAWAPSLVINGKRYYGMYYVGRSKQFIISDEQGKVLKDEQAAHLVRDMLRVAFVTAHPAYINERTNGYVSSQKGIKGMNLLLTRFDEIMSPVRELGGAKYEADILAMHRAAEIGLRFQRKMCEYWLLEAEWGNERGGTRLKAVNYEEWQWLMERLHEKTLWLRDEIERLEQGADAAKNILRLMGKKTEIRKRSPELKSLLEVVTSQKDNLAETFEDLKEGRVRGYERGLDEDYEGWQSRLKWVDKVDGGKA